MFLVFSAHFQEVNSLTYLQYFFMLRLDSLASKSVFVIKLACANLSLKSVAVIVLNSGFAIYLS